MGPIQVHFFRIMARHHIERLALTIDYPVTGLVVIPSDVSDLDDYISRRQASVAKLRMEALAASRSRDYANMTTVMMMVPAMRQVIGIDPKMPPADLRHTSPAAACQACQTVVLCDRSLDTYKALRTNLERILAGATMSSNHAFCETLEVRFNRNPLS